MMNRRAFLATVSTVVLAAPLVGDAQTGKVWRIAILHSVTVVSTAAFEGFRGALSERGYIEGQNISFDIRMGDGKSDRLPALAAELLRRRPDVIVAGDPTCTEVLRRSTVEIPIVMAVSTDPVAAGVVASLARPGGNVTGLSILAPELSAKRLEVLKETVRDLSRVALLSSPTAVHHPQLMRETEEAAQRLDVVVVRVEASRKDEIEKAFQSAIHARAGAVLALQAAEFSVLGKQIADLGLKYRLPTMTAEDRFVEQGGLMRYGASTAELWRRAAGYVDRILKGAKAADLPVEQPSEFRLDVNLKTAKALGLTIPQSVLVRADRVIQ
jgi:putative ABC transport system substrate-binding protein